MITTLGAGGVNQRTLLRLFRRLVGIKQNSPCGLFCLRAKRLVCEANQRDTGTVVVLVVVELKLKPGASST